MKKVVVILLFLFVAVAACEKKEAPRSQEQPYGPIHSQDELKLLRDAVKSDPGNAKSWIALGNLSMDSGNFTEAIDAYQKALEIDPKNVDVRVDMGTCYRSSGRSDMAIKEYKKALEINPNHPMAHKNLGVVLVYDMKDKNNGLKEFEKYIQLSPNAPDAPGVRQEIEKLKSVK